MKLLTPYKKQFFPIKEDEIDQTKTPEFKKWFGNSKVVKNGKPLVVYHGSKTKFDTFDLNKTGTNNDSGMWGKGFYFSPIRSFSKSYGGRILKCYLNIKNPFIVTQGMSSLKKIVSKDLVDKLSSPIWDNPENVSKEIRQELISLGFDGVFQYEAGQSRRFTQIVAFYPNQIKSATDNNGSFSKSSNNIYEDIHFDEKTKTVRGYLSPEGGDISDSDLDTLANVYADCRDDSEDKDKCSKIAWSVVKKKKKKKDK